MRAILIAKTEKIMGEYTLPNKLEIEKTRRIVEFKIISDDKRILIIFLLLIKP
jgi:hypothetical protein